MKPFPIIKPGCLAADRGKGFTLLELLITVAIITTLLAVLLAGEGSFRHSAESAICMSNLRQIGVAMSLYLKDHNMIYPRYNSEYSIDDNDVKTKTDPERRWCSDLVNGGYADPRIFICPTMPKTGVIAKNAVKTGVISYGLNIALSIDYPWPSTISALRSPSASSLKLRAKTIIAGDAAEMPNGIVGSSYMYTFAGNSEGHAYPRHQGFCNILWADGSVSAVRAKDPKDPQSLYHPDSLGRTYDADQYWLGRVK